MGFLCVDSTNHRALPIDLLLANLSRPPSCNDAVLGNRVFLFQINIEG